MGGGGRVPARGRRDGSRPPVGARLETGVGCDFVSDKDFQVLPRRWVVERTFAWLSRYLRLVRVYEKRVASSIAMIWIFSISILLKKLYPSPDKEILLN